METGTLAVAVPEPDFSAPITAPVSIDPANFLWLFFWVGILVTAGFAFGLVYHWLRYGNMYPLALAALPIYGIGVFVLIGAMLAGIGIV